MVQGIMVVFISHQGISTVRWRKFSLKMLRSFNGNREISEGILHLINEFGNQSKLFPTGKLDFFGIEDLYTQIQLQFEGGEDVMSD